MSELNLNQDTQSLGAHPPERLRRIELLRGVTLAAVILLILLGLAWELKLAPLKGGTGALALKVIPLTFALSGVARHRLYTYRWLSLLVWLYFTEGIVRSTTEHGVSQLLALCELTLSVVMFIACAVYVRLRLKALPPKPGKKRQREEDSE